MKVEWLWKIKIGNYSYQVGDHVLCSTGTLRYIATIVSLLHVDVRSFLQLCLVADSPQDQVLPSVSWDALRAAALAPLQQSTFAELSLISLALLHPVSLVSQPGQVGFLSW